jgi:hypothetical protein
MNQSALSRRHRASCFSRALLAGLASAALLGGCGAPQVQDYARETPVLELRDYFNGTLDAYGIFTDRSGKVVKRFSVVMVCTWQGESGTLDEAFSYSDGSTQRRVWHLTRQASGRYVGQAGDVVGNAEGQQGGNAFHWSYALALPMEGRVIEVQLDDWMYLMNDKIMLNKATMRKWGVDLGEVTLSFHKR